MAVLFLTWIEVILFTKASIISKEIDLYMFGAAVAAAVINILIYYFFVYINRAMQLKTELSLVKMQYDNVKNTEENMKLLYDNIHGIKHDLEKHFLYIKTMEENGRGDDVIKYIDNVLGEQMNASHKMVFTDNDIFNALMNVRLAICNEKGIYPSINVESKAIDEIRTEDIAILFGNIFDNAIEAAEKTEDKIIIFRVMPQKDYISVYVENSFDGVFDEKLKSTKSDKHGHGMGLKNVRRIVDKYDGMLKCFPDGNMFCCDILLKRQEGHE
jgi:sensor histidine kinase regulating citrate/malate metabolism